MSYLISRVLDNGEAFPAIVRERDDDGRRARRMQHEKDETRAGFEG